MSRAKTAEEVRGEFILHIEQLVKYWASLPNKTNLESCEGLAFSILTTFDGCSGGMPAFDLIPAPHEDDKQYHIDNDEDYYERVVINECQLHELVFNKKA